MKSFAYPGNIEADILSIGAEQIPYMRTEWFSGMMLECQSLLLELLDCPGGGVIPYTASGTAAMESCVRSFAATRKKALVVNGGTFGARWAELCGYSGIPCDVFDVEFGKAPCWERLIQAIASGNYGTLLIQHHETSSGYLYDLSRLSDACRDHDVALVVDAISSFLTDPLSMRDSTLIYWYSVPKRAESSSWPEFRRAFQTESSPRTVLPGGITTTGTLI